MGKKKHNNTKKHHASSNHNNNNNNNNNNNSIGSEIGTNTTQQLSQSIDMHQKHDNKEQSAQYNHDYQQQQQKQQQQQQSHQQEQQQQQDSERNSNNNENNNSSNSISNSISNNNIKFENDPTISLISDWKQEGNELYIAKNYIKSREAYDKAIILIEDYWNDNSNNIDNNNNEIEIIELFVNLLSNRAIVSIKLKQYNESENDCNRIIDTFKIINKPKVWYRRAIAREGIAKTILLSLSSNSNSLSNSSLNNNENDNNNNNNNLNNAREYLLHAKNDLQECLKWVQNNEDNNSQQHQQQQQQIDQQQNNNTNNNNNNNNNSNSTNSELKTTVLQVAVRIQKLLHQIPEETIITKSTTTTTTETMTTNNNNNNNDKANNNNDLNNNNNNNNNDNNNYHNNHNSRSIDTEVNGNKMIGTSNGSHGITNGSGITTTTTTTTSTTPSSIPNQEQQKQFILQLLIARKVSIANHYQSNNTTTIPIPINNSNDGYTTNTNQQQNESILGEGFYFIHWKWWCKWTKYTRLFGKEEDYNSNNRKENTDPSQQQQQQQQHEQIKSHQNLRYFLSGSTITYSYDDIEKMIQKQNSLSTRKNNKNNDNKNNDNDSTTSSSSSMSGLDNDDDDGDWDTPPGPIDNSDILLLSSSSNNNKKQQQQLTSAFRQQWYSNYHHNDINTNNHNINNCHDDQLTHSGIDSNENKITDTKNNGENITQKQQNNIPPTPAALKPNLVRGYHYEILPREIYNALRIWYGEVTVPICRRTSISINDATKMEILLYPSLVLSTTSENNDCNTTTSTTSSNQKKRPCSACRAPNAAMRCKRCMSVQYCNRGCQENHWSIHKIICKAKISNGNDTNNQNTYIQQQNENACNGNNATNNINNNINTNVLDGRVGLNNLGNTCIMNSAIQCLSHATPLTRHFLSGLFKADINESNPLGTGGKLANAYSIVIKDLWWNNSTSRNDDMYINNMTFTNQSTSPTALKRAISLFAPRFAGYLQHDTQEFLAYLLDGLHEDLNRIINPPYVEMPDVSSAINTSIAAAKCWDAHRIRNDSIVFDTFYGQFRSTCICPNCNKVSVSFDSFNHVSLEIPQPIKARPIIVPMPVLLFRKPARPGQHPPPPRRYGVPYHHSSTYYIADFRLELSNLCQIPAEQLVLCEVYRNAIVNIYYDDNKKALSDVIHTNEFIVAYEAEHSFDDTNVFHAVASHCFVDPVAAKQTGRSPKDRQPPPDPFGIPFLTNFSEDLTCQQVWEHIWDHVGQLVNKIESNPLFDDRSLLQIRVVDSRGRPKDVFPSIRSLASSFEMDMDRPEDEASLPDDKITIDTQRKKAHEQEMTSLLPRNLCDRFKNYLGRDEDSFVFLSLEWTDPTDDIEYDEEGKEIEQSTVLEHHIDEERFTSFDNDNSWVEGMKKIKATSSVNNQDRVSLQECFATFTKPERLDEHNMWYCSTCKEHVRAMKTMQLWRLPNILIVHLKRFEFKQHHGFRRDKLDTLVDFPLEDLDMSDHCCSTASSKDCFVNSSIPAIYDCFAVTNHFGSMGFGHYTAFARKWNEVDGMMNDWALFDDANVRGIVDREAKSKIISSAAYVLFYRRRIFS